MEKKYNQLFQKPNLLQQENHSENDSHVSQAIDSETEKKVAPDASVKNPAIDYPSALEMLYAHHDL